MKKVILKVMKIFTAIAGIGALLFAREQSLKKKYNNSDRYRLYYNVMLEWMRIRNEKKKFDEYFKKYDYHRVVIYGTGTMADLLFSELKESDINISYYADRNVSEKDSYKDEIKILPVEQLAEVDDYDVIVITPIYDYESIARNLEQAGVKSDVISLEDVICELA